MKVTGKHELGRNLQGGEEESRKKTGKDFAWAIVFSVLTTVLFLLGMAIVLYRFGLEEKTIRSWLLLGYIVAPAVGGFYLGKRKKRFLWGGGFGALFFLLYVLCCYSLGNGFQIDACWVIVPMVFGGMAGGMLS